jgi:hypothetical protein
MLNKILLFFLAWVILWTAPGPAAAQDGVGGEDWEFGIEIYGWGATFNAESATGDNIEIDFHDLVDDLNFTLMSAIGARKDKWSLVTDVIFFDIEDDEQGSQTVPVGPFSFTVGTDADVELKAWVVTPFIGYTVIEAEKFRLDVLAGARYLWLEAIIEVKITDIFGSRKIRVSDSGSAWDGVVGVSGEVNLTDKWYMPYYLDVGTGDSDSTWQVLGAVGYRFRNFDAFLGYRYLDWDWDDDAVNDVLYDLNVKGPYAGVKFVF